MDQVNQENELQKAIDDITKNSEGEQSADVAAGLEEQIQDQMGTPPAPEVPPAGDGPTEAMPPEGVVDGAPIEPAPLGEIVDDAANDVADVETPDFGEAPAPEVPVEAPIEGAEAGVAPEGVVADANAPIEPAAPVIEDETVEAVEPVEATEGVEAVEPTEGYEAAPVEGLSDEVVGEPVVEGAEYVEGGAAPELSDMGGNDITSVKEAMLRDLFPIMDKVEMGAEEKFELYRTMLDTENDKSLIAGAYEVARGIADEASRAEALLFLIKKADA